jgi:nitrite reductase/ring-hydroxylating ferredoxin subunit
MNQRKFLANVSDFTAETTKVIDADGTSILLVRAGGEYYAVVNKCPHLGLPLTASKVEGKTITCPFHNSQFDLATGENLDWVRGVAGVKFPEWTRRLLAMGRKPSPLQTCPIVVESGKIYLER